MPPVVATLVSPDAVPWIALALTIAVLLVIDLAVIRGRGGVMSLRTASIASVAWVGIALAFFLVLLAAGGEGDAGSFLAGYLVEKSLSLDNVFVFLLIFTAFAVPHDERHRLLTFGVVVALVLRGVFIVVGAAALATFGWLSFPFAALLIWTGWRMWRHRHDHGAEQDLVDRLAARLPVSTGPADGRLARRESGRWLLTTAGAALVVIVAADVIFAVDSVPAILAITSDTFIVFAANAFALLGLRPLFFLVADLVERLYYLKTALAALLVFVGAKLAAAQVVGKVGPEISLPIIAAILATGVIASLLRNRRAPSTHHAPGVVTCPIASTATPTPPPPAHDDAKESAGGPIGSTAPSWSSTPRASGSSSASMERDRPLCGREPS